MLMYDLLKNSSNYSSLGFYSKYKAITFNDDNVNKHNLKYFKYKAKLLGNTDVHGVQKI